VSELSGKQQRENSAQLKFFRKLKKKTVLTVFNIITEKKFTVGHKTRWELANEITEKFMSIDHIRDKLEWDIFVCPKSGQITTSLGKRRRRIFAPTSNPEDERLQMDIEQLNFIQNYRNDHREEETRYFVGFGTKWIIQKVMKERRKLR